VVSFMPRPLYSWGNGPPYPLDRRDPRAGLDYMEKRKFLSPPGHELRPLGHPARSRPLNRLSYPGTFPVQGVSKKYKRFIHIEINFEFEEGRGPNMQSVRRIKNP
jgi:hypothetical protein